MNPKNRKELLSLSLPSSLPEPYLLEKNNDGFLFDTEHGVRYSFYFTEGKYYLEDPSNVSFADHILMIGIQPLQDQDPVLPIDSRIKATVVSILVDLFNANPLSVFVYVCDQTDGREKKRGQAFNRWFASYGDSLVKIGYENAAKRLFAYAIYRKDHPARSEVESVIDDFVVRKEAMG